MHERAIRATVSALHDMLPAIPTHAQLRDRRSWRPTTAPATVVLISVYSVDTDAWASNTTPTPFSDSSSSCHQCD